MEGTHACMEAGADADECIDRVSGTVVGCMDGSLK